MGIYVGVKKIIDDQKFVIYEIKTNDFGGVHYFAKFEKGDTKILLYKDMDLHISLGFIDLNNPDKPPAVTGLCSRSLWYGVYNIIKSVRANVFPDCLDYCA